MYLHAAWEELAVWDFLRAPVPEACNAKLIRKSAPFGVSVNNVNVCPWFQGGVHKNALNNIGGGGWVRFESILEIFKIIFEITIIRKINCREEEIQNLSEFG